MPLKLLYSRHSANGIARLTHIILNVFELGTRIEFSEKIRFQCRDGPGQSLAWVGTSNKVKPCVLPQDTGFDFK